MSFFGKIIIGMGIASIFAILYFGGQWVYKKSMDLKPEVKTETFTPPEESWEDSKAIWCQENPKLCKG